jgi:hypothetical protein
LSLIIWEEGDEDLEELLLGCPSFYGKKGLKTQRNCCWLKIQNPTYKTSRCFIQGSPEKAMKCFSAIKGGPTIINVYECLKF